MLVTDAVDCCGVHFLATTVALISSSRVQNHGFRALVFSRQLTDLTETLSPPHLGVHIAIQLRSLENKMRTP
jgi:hypothetical protein